MMDFGARLSIKDNFSATMKQASKYQKQFRKDVNETKKALDAEAKKRREIRLNNAPATKAIREVAKRLEPLRKKVVIAVAVKERATERISKINSKLKSITKPVITMVDKTGATLSKIKSNLKSVAKLAGGIAVGGMAVGAGVGAMIGKGMKLEQQEIAMEHFIGVNNKGMSKQQTSQAQKDYMQSLRTNANATPFETNEVVSAGARAINVAGGNTKDAMDIVKMAEDMAALNPEKSLSDAMEALADLKTGETERMKEFGFKISQDDIKKAGGVKNVMNQKIQPYFKGGADKLGQSGSGLMSTITGNLGSTATDAGKKMLDQMKPALISIIKLMDKYSPLMSKFGENMGKGMGVAIKFIGKLGGIVSSNMPMIQKVIGTVGGAVSSVMGFMADKFSWVGSKMGFFKEVAITVFSALATAQQAMWSIAKPIWSMLADSVKIVIDIFQLSFPTIKGVVSSVWDFIKPIIDMMSGALKGVASAVSSVKGWVGGKVDALTGGGGKPRAMGVSRVPYDNYPIMAHEGETLLTKQESSQLKSGAGTTIEKLADTLIVREDADIDKIATALVNKLRKSSVNFGGCS